MEFHLVFPLQQRSLFILGIRFLLILKTHCVRHFLSKRNYLYLSRSEIFDRRLLLRGPPLPLDYFCLKYSNSHVNRKRNLESVNLMSTEVLRPTVARNKGRLGSILFL